MSDSRENLAYSACSVNGSCFRCLYCLAELSRTPPGCAKNRNRICLMLLNQAHLARANSPPGPKASGSGLTAGTYLLTWA